MICWVYGVFWTKSGSILLRKNSGPVVRASPSDSWGQAASLLYPRGIIDQHAGSPHGFQRVPWP